MEYVQPVVEVQGLKEGDEHRVVSLLALGKVAAVDDGNLDHDPEDHPQHSENAVANALDQTEGEKICRIPCPEHRTGEFASREHKAVAEKDQKIACN